MKKASKIEVQLVVHFKLFFSNTGKLDLKQSPLSLWVAPFPLFVPVHFGR